jgi:hypothetical protein
METGTTIKNPSIPARRLNFFHQILPPTGLIIGLVLTTVWISFLGYQIVRLVEAALYVVAMCWLPALVVLIIGCVARL